MGPCRPDNLAHQHPYPGTQAGVFVCRLSNPTLALSKRIGYSQNNKQTNHNGGQAMTTFTGTKTCQDHTLEVRRELCGDDLDAGVVLITTIKGKNNVTVLNPADDAAIALAIMNSATPGTRPECHPDSADYARDEAINWLVTARDRATKEAATAKREAARNLRRDEVLAEIGSTVTPANLDPASPLARLVNKLLDREEAQP